MFAKALAQRLERSNIHYGWVVIATIFFSTLVMSGGRSARRLYHRLCPAFRLGRRANFVGARRALFAVRADGAVFGGADRALWRARRGGFAQALALVGLLSVLFVILIPAIGDRLGAADRHRHRHDGPSAAAMMATRWFVGAARARHGPFVGGDGDGTIGLSAARRLADRSIRLASGARSFRDRDRAGGGLRRSFCWSNGRPTWV